MSDAKTLGEALCKRYGWERVLRIEIDLAFQHEEIRVTFAADGPLGGVFQTVKTFKLIERHDSTN